MADRGPEPLPEPTPTPLDAGPDEVPRRRRPGYPKVAAMAGSALVLVAASGAAADYWVTPELPAAASRDALTAYVVGTWQGILEQSDGKRLSMKMHVNEGGLTATTTYPGAKCVGVVGITEIGLDSLTYREHITSGSCNPDGSITLRLRVDGRLDFYYVPASSEYTASALLAEPTVDRLN